MSVGMWSSEARLRVMGAMAMRCLRLSWPSLRGVKRWEVDIVVVKLEMSGEGVFGVVS